MRSPTSEFEVHKESPSRWEAMVRACWNDEQVPTQIESKVWMASPVIKRYLHNLVSGDPNYDWPTWVRARHLPERIENSLAPGCGSGWLERALAAKPDVGPIIACDFSPMAVGTKRRVASWRPRKRRSG